MANNMLKLIIDLNSVSDTIPLDIDHEKLKAIQQLCVKFQEDHKLSDFVESIEDFEVLDQESLTWKVIRDLSNLNVEVKY